jgi:hypothetical protein
MYVSLGPKLNDMNLYIIRAWNSFGGGIGTYHVLAKGVNAAKKKVRESEKVVKRVAVEDVIYNVLIAD